MQMFIIEELAQCIPLKTGAGFHQTQIPFFNEALLS